MCLLCASSRNPVLARRDHVLKLLCLVEHPDALPADTALRLAQEILLLAEADGHAFRCEGYAPIPSRRPDPDEGRFS